MEGVIFFARGLWAEINNSIMGVKPTKEGKEIKGMANFKRRVKSKNCFHNFWLFELWRERGWGKGLIGIDTIIGEGQGVMFNLHFTLTEKKNTLIFLNNLELINIQK